jgi:hypothetical protein
MINNTRAWPPFFSITIIITDITGVIALHAKPENKEDANGKGTDYR